MLSELVNLDFKMHVPVKPSDFEIKHALSVAVQLATICSDWNLSEVEIDGKMTCIYDVQNIFEKALSKIN